MDNWSVLTHGGKVWDKKRREKKQQLEIPFDEDNRKEFLTGFHKRKVERQKRAIKIAENIKRQERNEKRRIKRQAIGDMAREMEKSRLESGLFQSVEGNDNDHNNQVRFVSDNLLTTVTTVEDFSLDDITSGWDNDTNASHDVETITKRKTLAEEDDSDSSDNNDQKSKSQATDNTTLVKSSNRLDGNKTKKNDTTADQLKKRKKKRDFKYESKSTRKAQTAKQRSKGKNVKRGKRRDGTTKK